MTHQHHIQTAAIVFVLSRYLLRDAARCIDHCRINGYNMIGVVRDDWAEAWGYLRTGKVDVIVVADRQHLDPERSPRIEAVADRGPTGRPKTQIIRRNAGA